MDEEDKMSLENYSIIRSCSKLNDDNNLTMLCHFRWCCDTNIYQKYIYMYINQSTKKVSELTLICFQDINPPIHLTLWQNIEVKNQ